MAAVAIPRPIIIAVVAFLACLGLVSLEKDIHSIFDLFSLGNFLVLLIFYFTPMFLLCFAFYRLLRRSHGMNGAMMLALLSGIPTAWLTVILILSE